MTASEYFSQLKTDVEQGRSINALGEGQNPLYEYLGCYYQDLYCGWTDEQYALTPIHPDLLLPLEERPPQLLEHLEWFWKMGLMPNLGEWPPMVCAVEEIDAAMTEHLLRHGSDPFYSGPDEESFSSEEYYMVDLDVKVMHISDRPCAEAFNQAVVKVAAILAAHGLTQDCYCIEIDHKNRTVRAGQAVAHF